MYVKWKYRAFANWKLVEITFLEYPRLTYALELKPSPNWKKRFYVEIFSVPFTEGLERWENIIAIAVLLFDYLL